MAKARMDLYKTIRSFFVSRGYLEVETPLLVSSPGMEPNLDPFQIRPEPPLTPPSKGGEPLGLITSPEYSMKKLLGSGLLKAFTITKVFRSGDEENDELHNPEFSMLEWYEQGIDYKEGMKMTEELVRKCAQILGYDGSIDLKSPWPRYRVHDLMLEYAGIDLDHDPFQKRSGRDKNGTLDTKSDAFYRVWIEKVEPNLPKDKAFFVYDYPLFQAALAQKSRDGKYAERFEAYLGELELCNAFTELTDPDEQRSRFKTEQKEREELGKKVWPIDEELLAMLSSIQNPTFGNALGLDRLLMVLIGAASISEVLLIKK